MSSHPAWFDALTLPATYPHSVSKIEILETHISWVVLTGNAVYKLKKPVDLGFANFTTLELRKAACDEELRLNLRTAPTIYERVVRLTRDIAGPRFEGSGDVLDYAVRMRQFEQDDLLLNRFKQQGLSESIIDQLGIEIAHLHRDAAIADAQTKFGEPNVVIDAVQVCLDVLKKADLAAQLDQKLAALSQWIEAEGQRLHQIFIDRKKRGWVRECHGDLHLRNLVLYENKPTLFDCIEFNEELRWIDVMSDIAFLVMDLQDHGDTRLSWRVLNVWLEQLGDFEGLTTLHFYLIYRSLVRAKVSAIRCQQADVSDQERDQQQQLIDDYLGLATRYTRERQGSLVLMHGVSGSGKSFVARQLVQEFGAIQIRSDVERKRLYGLWPVTTSALVPTSELYSDQANRKTYDRLHALAKTVTDSGFLAVIDAAFLKESERMEFIERAQTEGVPCLIISCSAPEQVLFERIRARQHANQDASDADAQILRQQLAAPQSLTTKEQEWTINHNTSINSFSDLCSQIRQRLPVV